MFTGDQNHNLWTTKGIRLFPFAQAGALTKRKGIGRPMAGFGLPNHIRVDVGTKPENDQFLRAVKDASAELKQAGDQVGNHLQANRLHRRPDFLPGRLFLGWKRGPGAG